MANQFNPNDPYRAGQNDDQINRQAQLNSLDNRLQPDPELAEGPASGGRIAMYAIAIALVVGALFYGLNNTSVHQAGTTPASQTAQTQPATPPAAPPGMRDVTPRNNAQPGTTTGAAAPRPAAPAVTDKPVEPANPASK